ESRPSRAGSDRAMQARIGRQFLRSRGPPCRDIAEARIVLAANCSCQGQREGQIDRIFAADASTQALGKWAEETRILDQGLALAIGCDRQRLMLAEEGLRHVDRALVIELVARAAGLEKSVLGVEGIEIVAIGGGAEFLHEGAVERRPASLHSALQTLEARG